MRTHIEEACVVAGSIVILPEKYAGDFRRFCELNPKPCPLLAVAAPGEYACPTLAHESDIRTDLPRYRVYRTGRLLDEPGSVEYLFGDDMVTFYIGCSFSFEQALMKNGIPVRNVEQQRNVPMFITNRQCEAAGPFSGPLVVTYRPIPKHLVARAIELSDSVKDCHGAPVYVGDPAELGIVRPLTDPDFGEGLEENYPGHEDDVPCFWACGVTAIMAVASVQAQVPLVITHSPGCMFVTDVPDDQ